MKPHSSDPLATLENVDWLISNGGEISLGPVGPVECAAVATDESNCLAMLERRDGESAGVPGCAEDDEVGRWLVAHSRSLRAHVCGARMSVKV